MTNRVRIRVVVPEAEPFEKVVPRTPDAIAGELATIGEGLHFGMTGLPIVIEIHPASELDEMAYRMSMAAEDDR